MRNPKYSIIRRIILVAVCTAAIISGAGASDKQQIKPSKAAEKALKQAEKLSSDVTKAGDARKNIADALKDSVLAGEAKTYYVAGRIGDNIYNDYVKKLSINPKDPKVDKGKMADALMDAYHNFTRAIELDTVTDRKGRIKTKYSPELALWIHTHIPQFYNAGIQYTSRKEYYPKACEAFEVYATYPEKPYAVPHPEHNDSTLANAFFYAGVCAYNGGEYKHAAGDFQKAIAHNYPRQEALLNQMVCYRRMAENDSTLTRESLIKITELAQEGLRLYGYSSPVYIQKFVAGALQLDRKNDALDAITSLLIKNPGDTRLLSLKAETLALTGLQDDAIPVYMQVSKADDVDFPTLLAAAKLLTHKGITELNKVQTSGRTARKKRKEICAKWLTPALEIADKAKGLAARNDKDYSAADLHDLENTIATIHYYTAK